MYASALMKEARARFTVSMWNEQAYRPNAFYRGFLDLIKTPKAETYPVNCVHQSE